MLSGTCEFIGLVHLSWLLIGLWHEWGVGRQQVEAGVRMKACDVTRDGECQEWLDHFTLWTYSYSRRYNEAKFK